VSHYLITGGAGFIGSHYVSHLLSTQGDAEITVLDLLTYAGDPAALPDDPRVRLVVGDVCDRELVARLCADAEVVVHFAAESHVDRSIASADRVVRTNVLGTSTLLGGALRGGVEKFLHVSTDEVYGSIDTGSWTERDPVDPRSPYSASKAASDLLALAHHRTHGLPVCVTRCSNNYGPRQFPEKVIPLFVTRLLNGLEVPLYGDGGHVRDWLHVEDHCRALDVALEHGVPGEVYNVGGGTSLTNLELTGLLIDAVGAEPGLIRRVADRPGHDRRHAVDDSRLRARRYRPTVSLDDGLAQTLRWYRDHHNWWERRCPTDISVGAPRSTTYLEVAR